MADFAVVSACSHGSPRGGGPSSAGFLHDRLDFDAGGRKSLPTRRLKRHHQRWFSSGFSRPPEMIRKPRISRSRSREWAAMAARNEAAEKAWTWPRTRPGRNFVDTRHEMPAQNRRAAAERSERRRSICRPAAAHARGSRSRHRAAADVRAPARRARRHRSPFRSADSRPSDRQGNKLRKPPPCSAGETRHRHPTERCCRNAAGSRDGAGWSPLPQPTSSTHSSRPCIGRFARPSADILGECVIARPAQAVALAARRIDAEGMIWFGGGHHCRRFHQHAWRPRPIISFCLGRCHDA